MCRDLLYGLNRTPEKIKVGREVLKYFPAGVIVLKRKYGVKNRFIGWKPSAGEETIATEASVTLLWTSVQDAISFTFLCDTKNRDLALFQYQGTKKEN